MTYCIVCGVAFLIFVTFIGWACCYVGGQADAHIDMMLDEMRKNDGS